MSFRTRLQDDITIETIGETSTDIYGGSVEGVTDTRVVRGKFNWQTTTEDNTDRQTTSSIATVVLPPEVSISSRDRIVYAGETFLINGRPMEMTNHHGPHHIVVPLKVFEG